MEEVLCHPWYCDSGGEHATLSPQRLEGFVGKLRREKQEGISAVDASRNWPKICPHDLRTEAPRWSNLNLMALGEGPGQRHQGAEMPGVGHR